MKCFVTVGSTKFESLISTLFNDEILQTFSDIGIKNIHIQNGNGKIPDCFQPDDANDECWAARVGGIKFVLFRYKNSISEEMANADLIIGHAGAGTCMEVLELGKPFVAVINNALMDDHQSDLAGQLAKDGHLLCTIPENLHKTLRDPSLFSPAPFPKSDPTIFSQFMKNLLGV